LAVFGVEGEDFCENAKMKALVSTLMDSEQTYNLTRAGAVTKGQKEAEPHNQSTAKQSWSMV
jgi:hypothetical protein